MARYSTAAAVIALLASTNIYSHAFTSPSFSKSSNQLVAETSKPFGVTPQLSNSLTSLQMGFMEDFLAGTDNDKRQEDNDKYLATLDQRVKKVNALEAVIEDLGDDELLAKSAEFRKRLAGGEDINGPILEEAFAVVREAA